MKSEELVLCVDSEAFERILDLTVHKTHDRFIDEGAEGIFRAIFALQSEESKSEGANLLDYPVMTRNNPIGYVKREICEYSPVKRQLIPYVFLTTETNGVKKLFSYWRAGDGDERLKGKCSIGIGGHVNVADFTKGRGILPFAIPACLRRELREEVTVTVKNPEPEFRGMICDNADEVSRRHIGLVYELALPNEKVSANEDTVTKTEFLPVEDQEFNRPDMENWSKIVFDWITKGDRQ